MSVLAFLVVVVAFGAIFFIVTGEPETSEETAERASSGLDLTETPESPEPLHGEPGGIFTEPVIFSSEELEALIAAAPHYTQTRPSEPHPPRKMTTLERDLWIIDYNVRGGINAQEFELYKIVNEIRAEYGLPPFILCPRLSRAARLFSYLQVKYHTVGHEDAYYGDMMQRSDFFGAFGTLYMENANAQRWYIHTDGRIEYIYLSPQEIVDVWMSSEGHRAHILTTDTTHVGFGVDSGIDRVVPTMKSIMPRR
jgi:uncharacterized protein YkwD